jgi:hypothetical protein
MIDSPPQVMGFTCPSSYKLEQLSVLLNRGSGSFSG